MVRRSDLLTLVAVTVPLACGNQAPPPAPPPPAAPFSHTAPLDSSAAEPEPVKRRPFEVSSACSDVVTVVFADDPKAPKAGRRTIAPSGSIEGPREPDGNQTVWLLDDKGEPLIKVHVTRGMKRVEVGKSCRTMDAR